MYQTFSIRKFTILPTSLILWLLFGTIAISWVNTSNLIFSISILAFTVAITLLNPFRLSGWFATIIGLGLYLIIQIALTGSLNQSITDISIFFIVQIIATVLAFGISRQSKTVNRQLEQDHRMIEDLRIRDPETGLVRYAYALQTLKTEIVRSRRKNTDISVLLTQMRDWQKNIENLEIDEIVKLKKEISTILLDNIRLEDTAFKDESYGAILPETNPEGAAIVARRIINQASKNLRVDLYVGIAHFPTDAVTEDKLVKAAEHALKHAESTDNRISFFSQLQGTIEDLD
jgi:GGDEF domain-containing protein